ncbi:MAG: glycosyltransferase [Cyanobacteria bacterium P01_H01_bin.74]
MPTGSRKKFKTKSRILANKIYFSFSSEGYGHSSRVLALAKQCSDTSTLLMGSYGYALERLQSFGYPCVEVTQEVKFVGDAGQFDVGKTILTNPSSALGLNNLIQEEATIIKQHNISLVIADGRIAPVLAAERLTIPCLVVTNQSAFYPFFERNSTLVKLFGRSFEWVMKLWLSSAEEILIPDFPPPYTICLPNLSHHYQVKKRTRFVGPLVAWQAADVEAIEKSNPDSPLVVVSLGGHEYRRPLFDAVLALAAQMPQVQFIVISNFSATILPPNLALKAFVKDAAPYFKAADVVITQAGHSTAMELLTLGKPAVIVPDAQQIEQENNALRMQELGVCKVVSYQELVDNNKALKEALEMVLNGPCYSSKSAEFSQLAKEQHGADYTYKHIAEFARRLSAY